MGRFSLWRAIRQAWCEHDMKASGSFDQSEEACQKCGLLNGVSGYWYGHDLRPKSSPPPIKEPSKTVKTIGRKNIYVCDTCQYSFITIDLDNGIPPYMSSCQRPVACQGMAKSKFYTIDQGLPAEYGWYKPDKDELVLLEAIFSGTKSYVERGGLVLKKLIKEEPKMCQSEMAMDDHDENEKLLPKYGKEFQVPKDIQPNHTKADQTDLGDFADEPTDQAMTAERYEKMALRTMADQWVIRARMILGVDKNDAPVFKGERTHDSSVKMTQIDNAARGMAGDVGEVNSCIQACLEYGKPLDLVNLLEELGDVQWRIIQMCNAVGFTLEQVFKANIAKLKKRYPNEYSDFLADEDNRDRKVEAEAITHVTTPINPEYTAEPEPLPKYGQKFHIIEARNVNVMPEGTIVSGIQVAPTETTRYGVSGLIAPNTAKSQTGQGFAEPPLERDSSYTGNCSKCGKPTHHSNTTGVCPDCYRPNGR